MCKLLIEVVDRVKLLIVWQAVGRQTKDLCLLIVRGTHTINIDVAGTRQMPEAAKAWTVVRARRVGSEAEANPSVWHHPAY